MSNLIPSHVDVLFSAETSTSNANISIQMYLQINQPIRLATVAAANANYAPQPSVTPLRPARSVKYCQATLPDLEPRVACHSIASARRVALSISTPKASQ
jgi:hypothetical protein